MKYDIKVEFGKMAKKFRIHFGLSQMQIANLINISASEYSDLENGITNYSVEKLQSISSVYGLLYYQMGNPKCKFPAFSKLPQKTKYTISTRERPLKIYNGRLIVEHLTVVLSLIPKNSNFLIQDISDLIKEKFKVKYDNEELSGTISKKFISFVVKTSNKNVAKKGPGAKPYYYQIVKQFQKKTVDKAKEILGSEHLEEGQ